MLLILSGMTEHWRPKWSLPLIFTPLFIQSVAEGLQQGDPLCPLLFCLSIQSSFTSEFCVCYMDDITLRGPADSILDDLRIVASMEKIGVLLNCGKSEVICCEELTCTAILSSLPGAQITEPSGAILSLAHLWAMLSVGCLRKENR